MTDNNTQVSDTHYVEKHDDYASKGLGGTALDFGIAGTALGLMNGRSGIFNALGNGNISTNNTSGNYVTKDVFNYFNNH